MAPRKPKKPVLTPSITGPALDEHRVMEGPRHKSQERTDTAWKAAQRFRRMLPGLNSFARALTRNNEITVVMHPTMGESGGAATDGSKVYMMPPLSLGHDVEHDRPLCDKRDDQDQLRCPACAQREDTLIIIYHELAHVVNDSFITVDEATRAQIVKRAIETEGSKYGRHAQNLLDTAPEYVKESFAGISNIVSPFFPFLVNCLEDARVNRAMWASRPGTKPMFDAQNQRIFVRGIELPDGTYERWYDRPLNSQALISLYAKASGYDVTGWFVPEIEEMLKDNQLGVLLWKLQTVRSIKGTYELAFPVLNRLRELGFCRSPEDPEPEPQPEDESDDKDNDSSESGSGEPDPNAEGGDQDDKGSGDNADSTDANEGDNDGQDEAGTSDDEGADGDASDGPATGDGSVAGGGESDPGGEADGEGESDGTESDRSGDEESAGDSQGSGSGSGDPQDGDGGDEQSDSDAGEPGTDERDSGRSSGRGSGSTGDGNESGSDDVDSADAAGSDASDGSDVSDETSGGTTGGSAGVDPEAHDFDDPTAGGAGGEYKSGDKPRQHEDSETADDLDDYEGDPYEDAQQGTGDIAGPPMPPESHGDGQSDGAGTGDTERRESSEDDVPMEADLTPHRIEEMGTAEDAGRDVAEFGGHGEHLPTPDEVDDMIEVARAIIQSGYFEAPSQNILGVRVHEFDKHFIDSTGEDISFGWLNGGRWMRSYSREELGIDVPAKVAESYLGKALMRTRAAFDANRAAKRTNGLKAGRVNGRTLARRAPVDDERLFYKKTQPGKRDYFVVIGIDISGSTAGANLKLAKMAAMAQAELLTRTGVKFEVWAHTADASNFQTYDTLMLDMYLIKGADEPWDDKRRFRLAELGPVSGNLDGHSMEFYRKRCERVKATDKVILYYTDGAMPASNYDEELEILKRELATCKRQQIEVMGVGIRTDSPTRHGLDTVRIDEMTELERVVHHLEKKLAVRV